MDTDAKIFGLLATVEQQQKSLEIAAQALEQTRQAMRGLIDEVQGAAAAGASAGAAQALEQAGLLVAEAAGPTMAAFKQLTASAAIVEGNFRSAAAWATWQQLAMVVAGCVSLVVAVWLAVAWQRSVLTDLTKQQAAAATEITTLQATVEELAQKGGRTKFSVCGDTKRRCVRVNQGMGTYTQGGEHYMIVDGY